MVGPKARSDFSAVVSRPEAERANFFGGRVSKARILPQAAFRAGLRAVE
jgi:hypothetical protein